MSTLRALWPMAFKIERSNIGSFIVQLVVFAVVCTVVGWIMSLLSHIWIIGWIFGILGSLMEVYCVVGVVLSILVFVGVLS